MTNDEPTPLLEVRDLRVRYGGVRALDGVSVTVRDGEIVAVLGNNGAGKTTLLRAISAVLGLEGGTLQSGTISLGGRRIEGRDPGAIVRAGLVQVPEGRRIFARLTVEENLRAAALATRRSARAANHARVLALFPVLGEKRTQRAGLLSGGQQQMLAIGRALMTKPRLLLLDEPSLGLAPKLVHQIAEIVEQINAQGTAVLIVEQNAAMALEIAQRAYVLETGRVALEGPAAELAASDDVRDRYLGIARADAAPPPLPAAKTAAAPELRLERVGLRFGGVAALSHVSFTVAPGAIHALIGPNGAGKSSLLNVVTGVYPAGEGTVRLGETELTRLPPHRIARLGVSRTFQNIALSPAATVQDNLMLGRYRLGRWGYVSYGLQLPWARRERRAHEARVHEVAALCGLSDVLSAPVATLAYGARKRVELGRALCSDPALLLLDEPVAGMNAGEKAEMASTIAQVRGSLGLSILLVEHDMTFVMGLAERVTVLDFGRLIADGTPAEVQHDPEVLRAYLGRRGDTELAQELAEEEDA